MFTRAFKTCPRDSGLLAAQRACIHWDVLSASTAGMWAHFLHSTLQSPRVVLASSDTAAIVQEFQAAPMCSTKAQPSECAGSRGE